MAVNVAISGFGRIGRLVLRSIIESKRKDINVVAINDLAPIETNAFLLSMIDLKTNLPILPNPLIATFTAIFSFSYIFLLINLNIFFAVIP